MDEGDRKSYLSPSEKGRGIINNQVYNYEAWYGYTPTPTSHPLPRLNNYYDRIIIMMCYGTRMYWGNYN